jgi:hypothetical protein
LFPASKNKKYHNKLGSERLSHMAKKLKRKRKGKVQWSYKKQEEWPGAC